MRHTLSPKERQRSVLHRLALVSVCSGLLSGCASPVATLNPTAYAKLDGNWQFSSSASTAASLPALGGSLTANGGTISGRLHPLVLPESASPETASHIPCAGPTEVFPVTGSIDSAGNVTLASNGFSGGTLSLKGALAPSQQSLVGASYSVSGGPCALSETPVAAAEYTPISGTYRGTIQSISGPSVVVSTAFTQTSTPDANGAYHLQGTATFGSSQSCLSQPVVSDSTVTGSTLSATYTQTANGVTSSIAVAGTFNPGATTLTLNSYVISGGPCDGDTGSGTLTLQP